MSNFYKLTKNKKDCLNEERYIKFSLLGYGRTNYKINRLYNIISEMNNEEMISLYKKDNIIYTFKQPQEVIDYIIKKENDKQKSHIKDIIFDVFTLDTRYRGGIK